MNDNTKKSEGSLLKKTVDNLAFQRPVNSVVEESKLKRILESIHKIFS